MSSNREVSSIVDRISSWRKVFVGGGETHMWSRNKETPCSEQAGDSEIWKKIAQLYFIKTKPTRKTHEKIELKCLEHVVMETVEWIIERSRKWYTKL